MNVPKADLRGSVQRALGVQNERLQSLRNAVDPVAVEIREVDEHCRTLNFLLEALEDEAASHIEAGGIGFGSSMTLRNLDSDTVSTHRIMSGDALDLDAGHMSIESVLGSALLGKNAGDVIVVATPGGERRLRVEEFRTLFDFLDDCSNEKKSARVKKKSAPARRSRQAPVAEAGR